MKSSFLHVYPMEVEDEEERDKLEGTYTCEAT